MEIDSTSHLLDIHPDRCVINEGDSARVRFEQTRNHSFVPLAKIISQFLDQFEVRLVYGLTRYKETR